MCTFKKEERLCSRKLIGKLFTSGNQVFLYPFKLTWLPEPLTLPVQVLINVPKRRFKRATDRNRLRRQIKEAYRLNKEGLLYPVLYEKRVSLLLAIAYIGKEMQQYAFIESRLKLALGKLLLSI